MGFAAATGPARAVDSSIYLLLPNVVKGEREFDWHAGIGSRGRTLAGENDAALGFGYGATDTWFTELAVRYRRVEGAPVTLDSLEWENIYVLAEPGEWPLDVGIVAEAEVPHASSEGASLRVGPLLQREIGRFQANINILASRYFRTAVYDATQFEYQAQFKLRYREPLEFGVQAFGDFSSNTRSFAPVPEQMHRWGPAVLGRFVLPGERSLNYNAALLFGTTAGSPDRTFRIQVEYEF
jgi:hypothetical protein